ncbi:hypothetical protein [Deinococcus roseus]|uniref:DUF3887 domain-containing protein n=1 Tax=Deinococcus roseus TaxID=392414 RepID=A0ABQ2DCF7_9DEIO|nr:hypothetical protein [Deinococcus roseus]GGJ51022.1 hypothetical protein GCM10008938_41280 [Deinococcus roseus]
MQTLPKLLLTFALLAAPVAAAQTAAEMLVVTAISAQLDSSISLPKGTYGYTNPKYALSFAQSLGKDASNYQDYQLYVATGLTAKLAPVFVQQLQGNFAAAGYFMSSTSTAGNTTRSEFTNDTGKVLLLFTTYQKDAVYFLVGRKK